MRFVKRAVWMTLLGFCTSCGVELPTEEALEGASVGSEEDTAETYLLGDESEYEADESEVNLEHTEEDHDSSGRRGPVISTLRRLHNVHRRAIAACAGLDEVISDFETQRQDMMASGATREEVKNLLRTAHQEMRTAVMEKREEIESCRADLISSETGAAIRSILDNCWSTPEAEVGDVEENGEDVLALHRPHPRLRRAHRRHHLRLPHREDANFGAQECLDSVASGKALLAGLYGSESDAESDE